MSERARIADAGTGAVREKRRQELVLAAFELIGEHGFEGLRTRDVAARVGVNIATLHYYGAAGRHPVFELR